MSNHFQFTCVLHSLGIVTRFVAEGLPPFLEEKILSVFMEQLCK